MPYLPVDVIEVRCWGQTVGAIALDPATGFYAFEYESRWLPRGIDLAPTTMPVSAGPGPHIFTTIDPTTYRRLPAMIADSLPDNFGNALTNAYLVNQGVPTERITALDRLAYLGSRGMGALEFRPARGPRTQRSTALELSELVIAARSALSGSATSEGGITSALSHLIAVGTSAGGARAKAVVALNPSTGEIRSGQVPADPGFEHWLLKLDGVGEDGDLGTSKDFGRIEYAYSRLAGDAGISMSECRLLEEGGRAHFMTKRFDRQADGSKVHAQSLCALGHLDFRLIGAHDYAQLFEHVDMLGLGPEVRAEVFRRMVFNVAAANCDDHTKNFSFILREGGAWELAPAYDVTHAHSPDSVWTRQHLMAVNGRTTGITLADVSAVGDRFGVPEWSRSVEQVLDAVAGWPRAARDAGVSAAAIDRVAEHIRLWSTPLRRRAR
jgi:serine/threonine-protein kinase HipA